MLCRKLFRNRVLVKLWVVTLGALVLIGLASAFLVKAEAKAGETLRLSPSEGESLGWDSARLDEVFAYAASLSTDALMIVTDGQTLGAFGNIEERYHVHSIRKVFLSALVGQHIGAGARRIGLEATLRELGVDDSPLPLTALQKTATVRHLLKSVSGINHPAAAEAGLIADKNRRLGDEANVPGEIWAYNNWDYNALTTIFERQTGMSIAEAFKSGIADPVGMQDFVREDVSYLLAPERSRHKAAMFRMSARDLVRFGQLYLGKGALEGRRIISSAWVERINVEAVDTGNSGLRKAQGLLWWIPDQENGLPVNSFWAWGFGHQALLIIPKWRTVIVHQSDTTEFRRRFFGLVQNNGLEPEVALERLILSCQKPTEGMADFCAEDRFVTRREFARLLRMIADARNEK